MEEMISSRRSEQNKADRNDEESKESQNIVNSKREDNKFTAGYKFECKNNHKMVARSKYEEVMLAKCIECHKIIEDNAKHIYCQECQVIVC